MKHKTITVPFSNELSRITCMYNLDGEIPCLWVKTTAQYAGDVNLQALAPHEVLELADLLHSMYDDMMRNFPHKN